MKEILNVIYKFALCELFLFIVVVAVSSSRKVLNLGTGNYKNTGINISPPLSTQSRAK